MAEEQMELPEVVVKVEPEAPAPTVKAEEKTEDAIKDLRGQYEELEKESEKRKASEEAARVQLAAARQEADEFRRQADAARAAAVSSNMDTVTTALASAQAAVDAAKRDRKVAREAGDIDAENEAEDRLIQARIDLRTYDEAKANLEARKAVKPERTAPSDPVEAYVQNRTEKTANWLRSHPDFITDQTKNLRLTAAHYAALAENLRPDTPEYFEHVEKAVGLKKDATVTDGDNVQRPGAAKKAAPRAVAPVNSSSSGGGSNSNEVRLSAREAAAAADGTHVWNYDDPSGQKRFKKGDPIGVQEFARRKQKMVEQGVYDRTYDTQ